MASQQAEISLMMESLREALKQVINDSFEPLERRLNQMVNKEVKRRGSMRSNHDCHTLKERTDHLHAKEVYNGRRAYEENQKWQCQESKHRQSKYCEQKEQNSSISSKSKSRDDPYKEESWWETYQRLLHEKQLKEKVESNIQESPKEELVEIITHESQHNLIQSEVELEEIIIEPEEWENVVECAIQNMSVSEEVKLESEHEVKIEKDTQEKEIETSSEKSENELVMNIDHREFVLMTNHLCFILPSLFVTFSQVKEALQVLNCEVTLGGNQWSSELQIIGKFVINSLDRKSVV